MNDFQIISKLGEGAYSVVYKARRLVDGNTYALKKVKLLNLSDKEKQNALKELGYGRFVDFCRIRFANYSHVTNESVSQPFIIKLSEIVSIDLSAMKFFQPLFSLSPHKLRDALN